MPRVSVLLPTHNRSDVLPLAIDSVLAQTEQDFELLVVADGCTDDTVEKVSAIGDPRIRLFDLPKAAYYGYANRNIALREARGEFVAFAAHDDLLFPDHLAQLLTHLDAAQLEWAYSRPLWVSTDGTLVPYATNLTIDDEWDDFVRYGNTIPASCVVYRRRCLDAYGYWPENVSSAADWRHWITIITGTGRQAIGYVPVPTCVHFSANWKASRHSAVEEVRTWLEIADAAPWWPPALRCAVPPGTTEQQAVYSAMQQGQQRWLDDVRRDVEVVLDRVAWDGIRRMRPTLRAHDSVVRELHAREHELAGLRARVATLESECDHERRHRLIAEGEAARLPDVDESRRAEVVAACAKLRSVEDELSQTRAELRAYQERLGLTLASTSWRITAPIRSIKQLASQRGRSSR
jgi:hypothetical protein